MKTLFPGYFTPSESEFATLWSDSLFAFDANVLLGLYRSSAETQQVFFSVLDKIDDRIFLPHQAAREYLQRRLGVISIRADSYGKIRNESEKFAKLVDLVVQEHSLPNGKEMVTAAKDAANKILDLVEAAAKVEPDLLHTDGLLVRLAGLFGEKTGNPYDQSRLKEIHAEGAQRYAQGIPPGYKDEKKGEPDKYGDLTIWFQLIDQAKLTKKPIIFVTGDAKEDWWLQHRGETFGPRPELRQEMMLAAGVHFYMYTAPRFLEFAAQFLDLKLDTKKAESEFEKIEEQDKQTAARVTNAWVGEAVTFNSWFSEPVTYGRSAGWEPDASTFVTGPSFKTVSPEEEAAKSKYSQLLPINGQVFNSSIGKWRCEIVGYPVSSGNDRACYRLKFESEGIIKTPRHLSLWVSVAALERDLDWQYKRAISRIISDWLSSNQTSAEVAFVA